MDVVHPGMVNMHKVNFPNLSSAPYCSTLCIHATREAVETKSFAIHKQIFGLVMFF
jgi:hypothetical protein